MLKNTQQALYLASSATLLFCAFAISGTTLFVLASSHWHGPFRDMWEIYPFLEKIIAGNWSLGDLWESYGYSHRLFLPKLLFIADHQLFDATNHLLIFVSVICQILICTLFALLLWREDSISLVEKSLFISTVVCLQFSGTLLFNFMHTFDVQWFLCCFFIAAAFYQLSHIGYRNQAMTEGTSSRHLLSGGLLIVMACLCSFSAMAAWPVWLLLVFRQLKNLKLKVVFTMTAVSFVAFYALGVRSAQVNITTAADFLKLSFYVFVIFPFSYLSNPLIDADFLPLGNWAVLIVIPAIAILVKFWWDFLRSSSSEKKSRLVFFLALIGTFTFGVAVITAIGRGYDQSHVWAMRYQNIVMLFWSAVILLAILESREYGWRLQCCLRLPFLVAFAGFVWCQPLSWNQNSWLGGQVGRAHLALMMGYSHEVPMIAPTVSRSMIYVPGYNLERERHLYKQARKGIYHGDMADAWLNGVSAGPARPEVCEGLSWSLSPYKGDFSQYTSFVVSGKTAGLRAAYLTNESGSLLAVAIPASASSLKDSLLLALGLIDPLLKGFAAPPSSGGGRPYALVLQSFTTSSQSCTIPVEVQK